MRIAFVDNYYRNASPYADPIISPLLLASLGHDVVLVSNDARHKTKPDLWGFECRPPDALESPALKTEIDCVVAISRFDPALTGMLQRVTSAGVPLIVKGDTDGTLGYPLRPNYLRMRPLHDDVRNVLRQLKWRLPSRRWVGQKLKHVSLADRVVVESPGAAVNLAQVLEYWDMRDQIAKVRFIPNEVSRVVADMKPNVEKPKVVLAIARWDDPICKGADLLVPVVNTLLDSRGDYSAIIVGSGVEALRRRLGLRHRDRVTLLDHTDFGTLQKIVANARIMLVPSRLESFSYVSAEALCAGASLVATPIESLNFLAGGGAWGAIARDFSVPALTAALLFEVERWESGQRDPLATAAYWRARIGPGATGPSWSRLLEEVVRAPA